MNIVEINALSKEYKVKKKRIRALDNLSLTIQKGEIFGFLGPNGAGKSTTIKILTDQIRATSGSATIFGIQSNKAEARRQIGYLPENPAFYDFMTAREYLSFTGKCFNMPESSLAERTNQVLETLDLLDAANRPLKGFSKGMTQRLGLAQALLHDPDLFIFDEPMSGLDPIGRAMVKKIIKDLKNKGKTVFFSTHITSDVEVVCDRVGILVKGRLVAIDSVEHIMATGIEGYIIQIRGQDNKTEEIKVSNSELNGVIARLLADNVKIERVNPVAHNLEDFFLDTIQAQVPTNESQ